MEELELERRLAKMVRSEEDDKGQFYAFSFTADENGEIIIGSQSMWDGWADDEYRIELRMPRLVNSKMADLWESIGTPCVFVRDIDDLMIFYMMGGNALIERSVAEDAIPELLKPKPSYQVGWRGFASPKLVDPSASKKAPTPKLRMKVLKRDGRRCRICGRNPDDNVDLVLNVHHIKPWQHRGITDLSNLITLCHTCHTGLDPHYDQHLFSYLEPNKSKSDRTADFIRSVENYQRAIRLRE